MIDSLKKIYSLFSRKDRIKFLILFVLMLIASFFEVLGIGMIPAFVVTMAEPEKILNMQYIGSILTYLGITTRESLIFSGAFTLLLVYILKNVYLTYFNYLRQKFVYRRKIYLQNRIFKAYMTAPYTFYLNKNSAELLRNVRSEVSSLITGTIFPVFDITLNVIMFFLIIAGLLYLEPLITVITIFIMGGCGYTFLRITQKKTLESGKTQRLARGDMNRMVLQGLGGFKDSRVLNREKLFLQQYDKFAKRNMTASIYQSVVKSLPKPIIETLLVVGILTITLIMVSEGRDFSGIITILTLFGVAAVKLMPIFNNLIQQITTIRYSAYSVYAIFDDIELLENKYKDFRDKILKSAEKLNLEKEIELDNVSYRYPNSDEYAVKDISLKIPKGSAVAFVGESGAGKTTLVDVILGLLTPETGAIYVDGANIENNLRGWMKNIGYIQQSNYLMDERIFRNIAFGIPDDEVDKEKLNEAIEAAQLKELIERLPKGLRTRVGERGVRLSGGQQQRIAIARALYNDPQVLVMDEATSALDNITEKYVIEAIERLRGDRTIIMIAHRLTTVRNCDVIYMLNEGEIIAKGTYDELLESSSEFRKMSLVED
ncbi:ABC transporter ATP-binding protein [Rhodohalobacter sp. 614A]|uniref:ABC transporter ATP-binding protein n=1 Tax=Rhodohalobacter sp. 614A TaxID=2908649 RepID=UPI001F3A8373|nr:ABC transporter ATP-binding protein [Rhodohalobacter sp. 614A]